MTKPPVGLLSALAMLACSACLRPGTAGQASGGSWPAALPASGANPGGDGVCTVRIDGTGEPLWDYHQACVRCLRAAHCGDGSANTRDGTRIEIFDRAGIQTDTGEPDLTFEAAWNAGGAVYLRKTRVRGLASVEGVLGRCPGQVRSGPPGQDEESFGDPAVLIVNRS